MNFVSTLQFVYVQWWGRLPDHLVAYFRYLNFYGQKGARLGSDQTIYGHQPKRTYLIKTLSIFFYAPELHLKGTYCRRVPRLYTKNLLNRTGIRIYGLRHLPAQMATIHHTAAG
jgi:hypothetical protein